MAILVNPVAGRAVFAMPGPMFQPGGPPIALDQTVAQEP
jgi:hypothetical protein